MTPKAMTPKAALVACCFALAPLDHALSWGTNGHSIIAELAQRRLHPQVWAQIEGLLGPQVSLAAIASWADDITQQRPETINWHFVNIPYDASGYAPDRDCKPTPRGDCVINAIGRARATLGQRLTSRHDRTEALMFLVHFIGDVHQPLHVTDRNDAGGSKLAVTFFGAPMSLHAVWDVGLIEKRTYDWGWYVGLLERDWLPGKDVAALQRGTPVDWAVEAHAAAMKVAYALPEDLALGEPYSQQSLPTVDRQLAVAGVRLARVLNETFGHPGYVSKRSRAHEPMAVP